MTTSRKRRVLTTDDLLRRQEEPAKKILKLSASLESDGLDETSGLSDETSEEESASYELQRCQRRDQRNTGDEEDDEGEEELPLTSRESVNLDGNKPDFERVKTNIISKRPLMPTGATFASLCISAPLQASLAAMSIRTPTEVQVACIPPLLAGQSGRRL